MTHQVWNIDRAKPVGKPRLLHAARALAQKLEDKYHRVYVVLTV